ncbi:MAG: tetratricopeptide repeat protein [Elusimicrobia bacterium]|nr:tetratricopeptide repeat protein [Elusimicrobiota bacterium]
MMLNKNLIKLFLISFILTVFSFTGLKSAEKDYYQGVRAGFGSGDLDMLFELCTEWQEGEPENLLPLYIQAYIYHINHYPDEGTNMLLRVSEINPYAEQQLIPFAERLLEDLPENPHAMIILGEALIRSDRYEEAKDVLKKSISFLPVSAISHYLLGYIYIVSEDEEAVERHLLTGIDVDPCFLPNYTMLGDYYSQSGNRDAAEKIYKQGLKRSMRKKRTASFHLKLALIYTEKANYKKAIKILEEGLKIKPDNPGLMLTLGDIYMESGDFDKAEEIFKENFRFVEDGGELYSLALKARLQRIEDERKEKERGKIRYD